MVIVQPIFYAFCAFKYYLLLNFTDTAEKIASDNALQIISEEITTDDYATVDSIGLDTTEIKKRGRPTGTSSTRTRGAAAIPAFNEYNKLGFIKQVEVLLQFIMKKKFNFD